MITRRTFLGVPVAAALGAACQSRTPPPSLPYRPEDVRVPARSSVMLLTASEYSNDLSDLIGRGLRELGVAVAGKSVLLKPNLVEYEEEAAINTHPAVVAAAAVALRRAGAREVVVAEGPGHRRDIEYLLSATGFFQMLSDLDLPFVDLNHDDVREVPLRSWFTGLSSLALPVSVLAADLVVSMPKLKTHHWAGLTCGMKNLFGVVPGAVYGWPKNLLHFRGIPASILDLAATIRPGLVIVDGITGMEGDGPIMGHARPVGLIAMGTDAAAVDATCARVIGIDPARVPYLVRAGEYLGQIDPARIDQRGESVRRFRTDFALIPSMQGLRLAE